MKRRLTGVVRAGWLTDPGRSREKNEDSIFADPRRGVFVVADGLGGIPGGDVASRIAARRIGEALSRDEGDGTPEERVRTAIARAGDAIRLHASSDPGVTGMATTVVLVLVPESGPYLVAHVGDSRAYLLRDGRMEALTRDHSVIQELLDAGRISVEVARHHPQRHVITRSLGHAGSAVPELRFVGRRPGDRILLCSDGLTTMLGDPEIESILVRYTEPMQCCRELVQRANTRGGLDNISVVVIDEPPGPESGRFKRAGPIAHRFHRQPF
ncbi:MAG TPA: protein phosphatase 2C domain-containing protein [Methanoregulaceae archaeon]|nr:protein phosphatase 2C domain-containing protein [Methanoregulaceae archaeon]HQJ88152.1 protein phosphatase 2C domain-containing protein [Methanoregulaceae archaeon]